MKKTYETPEVEKIEFKYRDQVVTASGSCTSYWVKEGSSSCTNGNSHLESTK